MSKLSWREVNDSLVRGFQGGESTIDCRPWLFVRESGVGRGRVSVIRCPFCKTEFELPVIAVMGKRCKCGALVNQFREAYKRK